MLVVAVTFKILDAAFEEFRAAVIANAGTSLEVEPQCLRFDVCVDRDAGECFLYEIYTDAAAFDAHLKLPHFLSFDALTRPWVVQKTVRRYELLTQEQ